MKRFMVGMLALFVAGVCSAQEFRIKPVAEKKIKELPAGPLFWRI